LVFEQMQMGLLSAEAARTHPKRHLLTRSLGRELLVGVDVITFELRARDLLVQMTDGVHAALPEPEIVALVTAEHPEKACQTLVQRAGDAGSEDNLSVQIALILDPGLPTRSAKPWWRFGRRFG